MRYTAFSNETGLPAFRGNSMEWPPLIGSQFTAFEGDLYDMAMKDGVLHEIAARPSVPCRFDIATLSWVMEPELMWGRVRNERQSLLQASDWSTLPDVPLTTEKRTEWAAYRQALRDVTLQADPFNIVWPVAPG